MMKVILTPNPYRDKDFATVREAERVLNQVGVETRICLPFEVESNIHLPKDIRFSRIEREIRDASVAVCLGGDGTILHIAKAATRYNVPILGINIGTMGFMAELESSEIGMLTRIASGDYGLDRRMMLDVIVKRGKDIIFHDVCLNDIAITKGTIARIIRLNVKCDDAQAMDCGGDGLIVSTPTGSTAYSLASGGPVVEPSTSAVVITPICAHDMVSHSIVTSDERVISVTLSDNSRRCAYLSVDGGKTLRMNMGDVAVIRKSQLVTNLVRLKDNSFYDILNTKFRIK